MSNFNESISFNNVASSLYFKLENKILIRLTFSLFSLVNKLVNKIKFHSYLLKYNC